MLWDGPPRLSLGCNYSHKLVGVFPLEIDTRGGGKEGVGDGDILLLRGGRGDDGTLVSYAFVVDGGVRGQDMRRGTHCMHSWDGRGDDRELFKLLKGGLSQPKDEGLSVGTKGQECGGWETTEGVQSMFRVGNGFLCSSKGKQGQGLEGGGVRVLE